MFWRGDNGLGFDRTQPVVVLLFPYDFYRNQINVKKSRIDKITLPGIKSVDIIVILQNF